MTTNYYKNKSTHHIFYLKQCLLKHRKLCLFKTGFNLILLCKYKRTIFILALYNIQFPFVYL